jgi:hypothetical protein
MSRDHSPEVLLVDRLAGDSKSFCHLGPRPAVPHCTFDGGLLELVGEGAKR